MHTIVSTEQSLEDTPTAAEQDQAVTSLSVSIVVYRSDLAVLRETCRSLGAALQTAHDAGALALATVEMVDNGDDDPTALRAVLAEAGGEDWIRLRLRQGGGNVGYGRGHNGPLMASDATYHLVLNPDVLLDRDAILQAIRFLDATPDVGLIAPHVRDEVGTQQYLCRDYPSVFFLFLRGFAPATVRRLFRRYMEAQELRHRIAGEVERGIPLISGCFMLGRRALLQGVGGFSPEYFMYFEDSDLSLTVGRVAEVAYVPSVRIIHFGGGAARKGRHHVMMYLRSALTFYRRNGLRIV